MAIKVFRGHNSEAHQDRIVLMDHFGHEHEMTINTVFMQEKKDADGKIIPGQFESIMVDVDALIEAAAELHRAREVVHLEYMLTHYPNDPVTLAHPDNPINKDRVEIAEEDFPWPQPKNCPECK